VKFFSDNTEKKRSSQESLWGRIIVYGGKDLWNRWALSWEWKSEGFVDEQSCASTEEEVTCAGKRGTEIQKLVRGCLRETGSWFQRQGEAYRKERSVIRSKDDGGLVVDREWWDEGRVLRGGSTVMRLCRYERWVVVRTLYYVFIACIQGLYSKQSVILSQWIWYDTVWYTTFQSINQSIICYGAPHLTFRGA